MRSERRHHKQRMKKKAAKVAKESFGIKDPELIEKVAVRHADNLKKCTCSICKKERYRRKKEPIDLD